MSSFDLNSVPERSPLEATLAKFQPVPSRIDGDRLMFLAGQASVTGARRTVLLSPALSLSVAALSLMFGLGCLVFLWRSDAAARQVAFTPSGQRIENSVPKSDFGDPKAGFGDASNPPPLHATPPAEDLVKDEKPATYVQYIERRNRVLNDGVDVLMNPPFTQAAVTPAAETPPPSYRDLVREFQARETSARSNSKLVPWPSGWFSGERSL